MFVARVASSGYYRRLVLIFLAALVPNGFKISCPARTAARLSSIIPPELVNEMLTPQIVTPLDPLADYYGLGFQLAEEDQNLVFLHTGGTWGSTCVLWVYPETGQGAVVMTNSASGQGMIRFEILLGLAAEYGWPLDPSGE